MFKRVMVAVVGVPFLLLVLGWAPTWTTAVLLMGMCAIGAYEFMHAVAGEKGKKLVPLTMVAAGLVPALLYRNLGMENLLKVYLDLPDKTAEIYQQLLAGMQNRAATLAALALVFVFVLFVYAILHYGKDGAIPFADVTAAIFGGLVFPLMLSCLLLLRMDQYLGKILVFLPLCISFGSDTFALFAGMLFGKHKLAPYVSPKKTVEGAVGGIVGGVLGALLLTVIGAHIISDAFMWPQHILLFGVVGSVISQIGDLSFSVIKREFGVKDYGKLLPGHGGILDRFDSVTFVAPFVYLTLAVIRSL